MLWEYCSFLWYIWNGYFMLRSWWYRVFVMMWLFPVTMVLCDVMLWIFHVKMVIHVMPWLINVKVYFLCEGGFYVNFAAIISCMGRHIWYFYGKMVLSMLWLFHVKVFLNILFGGGHSELNYQRNNILTQIDQNTSS